MHHTHYHRPASVADAVKLLDQHGDDRLIAGGQSMLPAMRLGLASIEGFIDLGGVAELKGIRVEGNGVRIGAMTTHAEVAASKDVQSRAPAIACLAPPLIPCCRRLWPPVKTALPPSSPLPPRLRSRRGRGWSAWGDTGTPQRSRPNRLRSVCRWCSHPIHPPPWAESPPLRRSERDWLACARRAKRRH